MPGLPFPHSWGRRLLVPAVCLCMWPSSAFAGMTVYSLSEIAAARLDVISFFCLLVLILAWVFKKCWNALAADVTWIPALTYKSSLGAITVAALFCGLILTMISGARELMTPGAWDKVGTGYKLRGPQHEPELWMDAARRSALEQFRDALWNHAHLHAGHLPRTSLQRTFRKPSGEPKTLTPRYLFICREVVNLKEVLALNCPKRERQSNQGRACCQLMSWPLNPRLTVPHASRCSQTALS